MSTTIPVGIDLGTSFCAVSHLDADGCTQMLPDGDGEILTPSIVFFGDQGLLTGAAAREAALHAPERVATNAKRDMGAVAYRSLIGGQSYPPEVIQSCLLRQLLDGIVAKIGDQFQAVITVPAYFDESRRKATCDAAAMSGLPVLDIVNEPTAAALAFGERLGYLTPDGAPRRRMKVLVYDLGGGTFDVTVIELGTAEVRTLATDGDYELGGLHWDLRLCEFAASQMKRLGIDSDAFTSSERIQFQRAVTEAKHRLTTEFATVLEFAHRGREVKLPITRDDFEQATADLLERTLFTTKQAVQAAGLIWTDIDRVILVGGSSRMPAVRRALNELSGRTVESVVNPDEAVARGAAIFARYLLTRNGIDANAPKLRIVDVSSHGLGIEGVNLQTLRSENVILIPRNTPLPCEIRRSFVTRSDSQTNVKIDLLEGESTVPGQCARLAAARIRNLPLGLPKGTPINVRYSLQANGRLRVTASVANYGDEAQIELQRERGLADHRVQTWRRIVCRNGGFRDFEDALVHLVGPPSDDADDDGDWEDESEATMVSNLDAVVNFGAPRAAATALRTQFQSVPDGSRPLRPSFELEDVPKRQAASTDEFFGPTRQSRARHRSPVTQVVSYVLGAIVGLSLGYYLLLHLRPDLNLPAPAGWGREAQAIRD